MTKGICEEFFLWKIKFRQPTHKTLFLCKKEEYIEICSTFELGRRWKTEIGSGWFASSINFPTQSANCLIYRLAYIPSLMFEEGQSSLCYVPAWPTSKTCFLCRYLLEIYWFQFFNGEHAARFKFYLFYEANVLKNHNPQKGKLTRRWHRIYCYQQNWKLPYLQNLF